MVQVDDDDEDDVMAVSSDDDNGDFEVGPLVVLVLKRLGVGAW